MSTKLTRRQMAAALTAAPLAGAGNPPNILFCLSYDHTAAVLGAYGNPVVRTPNFDRFAQEGMRFDRAFTTAPQCVPSRVSMMTGHSPVAVRMGRFNSPLPADIVTLPEILRRRGYFTGICRRNFHLDGPVGPGPLMKAAFDKYDMVTFDKRVDYLDRGSPRGQTTARVNEFLDMTPKGRPFFLWVGFNDPHHPWDQNAVPQPPEPAKIPLPAHLPDLPGVREELARYYGEVERVDGEFQSVLDILRRRGLEKNTLVVFMGDNGMAFPHGKGSLYDPGLNVPFIVRWPGVVKPGTSTSELFSGEDLTPTLLEAAGAAVPIHMTGQSVLKLLRGEEYTGREHVFGWRLQHGRSTFNEKTRANGFDLSRCVRSKSHKLIYNCTPYQVYSPVDSANGPGWKQMMAAHEAGKLPPAIERAYFTHPRPVFELFDLERDPSELENLAGRPAQAKVERALKEALYERMIRDYDFLPLPLTEQ